MMANSAALEEQIVEAGIEEDREISPALMKIIERDLVEFERKLREGTAVFLSEEEVDEHFDRLDEEDGKIL